MLTVDASQHAAQHVERMARVGCQPEFLDDFRPWRAEHRPVCHGM